MKVFLDMDGVIVDFMSGACLKLGLENPFLRLENIGKYLIFTDEQFESFDQRFWEELEPTDDFDKYIALAYSLGDVSVLTQFKDLPGYVDGKVKWLKMWVPNVDITVTTNKTLLASKDSLLIDDYYDNVKAFQTAGGKAVCVPRPWNCLHKWACDSETGYDVVKYQLRK